MMRKVTILGFLLLVFSKAALAQCGGIMEPGFAFLTSSRGCAPFTVNIQTLYLSSVPGTQYFINWGDGTPEQVITQINPTGVTIAHTYPNTSINCGYDVVIDASNACNPRGSVVPINTQVIVWTNDVVSINPATYRVCQGYAASVQFTDNSTWNCFPRATRENNEPRWIQWLYGTGPLANQIPGVQVNSITPGGFPYLNPAPATNPIYPVLAPGQVSLPIQIPVTAPADLGREFVITLKNWNQCNPYDNVLTDLNPFNPVNGNLVNGDNVPQITTARIVIVPSPEPDYLTRLGGSGGPIQTIFCVGDNIYFDNETPNIAGASFAYTWEFYDNNTGAGVPLSTATNRNPIFAYPTSGQKLIRLSVRDQNAAGNCIATVEKIITISPSLIAQIQVTDLSNNVITPDFCQNALAPFTTFQVRFNDVSVGSITPTTQWRWEFYDQTNTLVRQEPASGFSNVPLGPFDESYLNRGIYRVRLIVRDNVTSCETADEVQVRVFEKPVPVFMATQVCAGQATSFAEASTLQAINGESIALREWDFNFTGVFTKDPAFDNQTTFDRVLGAAGTYQVALRVTTNQAACSETLIVPVVVDPLPIAAFTPDVTSGCSILTVTFNNTGAAIQPTTIGNYVWEADELTGLGFQPIGTQLPADPTFSPFFVYDFENIGLVNKTFEVRLRVITAGGCETISPSQTITVFPGTRSGFISTNYSPFNDNCSPQSINFSVDTETQSLNPADYRWQISDNTGLLDNISTGTTPAFSYAFANNTQAIKNFSVRLLTTLTTGCFGDSIRTIRISPVPISQFTIDTLAFDCNVMTVRLEAAQKGLTSYHWVIRENGIPITDQTSTTDFIIHTFNRPPASSVALGVDFALNTQNFANCTSLVTTQSITVPGRDNINAGFTATPISQSLPTSTVIINNTTNLGPWTFLWDFGDGNTATSANVTSHTYATYGVYTIRLMVTNNVCVETYAQQVEILAIPPVVDFSYDPPAGCMPLTVRFTNLSQFADPNSYLWDFGDGTTSRMGSPTHTYYQPGIYSVSLSATNITGQTVTESKASIIEVFPLPRADFEIKPLLVYIPGGIMYTDNRSFDASTYLWDFGDGTTTTAFEPEHRFQDEGYYTIKLTAYNQFNCADSTIRENAVRVLKGGQVLIPNAFSPNLSATGGGGGMSDGTNDVFLPVMRGVVEFEMLIFNRWGELLFESRDPERGWDGTYHGKLCQQDVYIYKVAASFDTGERVVRVGDVNLIR
ncbi:MAG: PKD domain-containing protein [Cyclobacteriaceae bacterium]|nr:PKD domain-containing protein [Cyclobacteriaceae bacterium]